MQRIICETYDENVILEHVQISLNDLKTVISIIPVKKRFECSAVVKEDELRKDEKKWKTMENTSINLSIFLL